MENISEILSGFGLNGKNFQCELITSGHINATFKVYSGKSAFILQKVNTDIFKDPEHIMNNISIVQKALKKAFRENCKSRNRFPEYLESDGKNYCIRGGFWRAYRYIESAEALPDIETVRSFGSITGEFHRYTENTDVSELYITLPDFHNIRKNISKVLALDNISHEQSDFYKEFLDLYCGLQKFFSPVRLVHNDVKWANALIDPETMLPDVLIDFDTVMPGYAAFDFGDAVRSACTTENNEIDMEFLRSYSCGYFCNYKNLTPDEAAAGIAAVAAELSARYLYDALTEYGYFSGLSYNEKLERHYRNLKLAEYAVNNFNSIKKIIADAGANKG